MDETHNRLGGGGGAAKNSVLVSSNLAILCISITCFCRIEMLLLLNRLVFRVPRQERSIKFLNAMNIYWDLQGGRI
jgi:hypothetical protein